MAEVHAAESAETVVMNEDQVLNYTQRMRTKLVDAVLKANEGNMPTDPKMATLMLQSLDGMDRAAIGRKRIRVDEKAAKNVEGMQNLVAEVLRQAARGGHSPAMGATTRVAPVLGADLPEPILVEGELSQAPLQLSIDEFNARFESSDPK